MDLPAAGTGADQLADDIDPTAPVNIVDVGPRDGFQTEQAFIPTDLKIRVIDAPKSFDLRITATPQEFPIEACAP